VRSAAPHLLALVESEQTEARVRSFLDEFGGQPLGFCVINFPRLAFAALRVGLEAELLGAVAAQPEGRWSDAVRAIVAGDFARAADQLKQIGSKTDEAEARLRAAEQLVAEGRRAEADDQLGLALAFYRSVGATRFIREGEALLAASA
jgi:hypothetical protein